MSLNVLVTGAKGQVGSELIQLGQQKGFNMLATGSAELDITQKDKIEAYITEYRPDFIINAAAHTAVDKAEEEVELSYAINRDGPDFLSQVCDKNKIPFLHISTDYVFDGENSSSYTETDKANPTSIYGKSKLAGEQLIQKNCSQYYILRVAWVFGENGHNFVKRMLRLAKERDELSIVSDQRGAPTWARDIATVLLDIVHNHTNKPIEYGVYHYNGTPSTTWSSFAQEIFEVATEQGILTKSPVIKEITTKEYPTPAKRPNNSVLNCTKIKQTLNINQPNWKQALTTLMKELIE